MTNEMMQQSETAGFRPKNRLAVELWVPFYLPFITTVSVVIKLSAAAAKR